ncbi:MAG: ABC transporter substrate-binding protein, partial [Geminicoccaceae bacterium]
EALPNFARVDVEGKPSTVSDFTVPTDGLESPWGMAQYNFVYDSERVPEPPRSMAGLLAWIEAHPGRFTYPAPPDHIGSTFLKHVLIESLDDPAVLQQPATDETFAKLTEAMWPMLEAVQPALWRSGQAYPASGPAMHQLLADGEIDVSMAFNPVEASRAIADGILPDTVRTFILEDGTIANSHFVAIPYNAAHKAGALVVANYLLSPEAQAEKLKPEVWGDGTVLDLRALSAEQRALFEAIPRGIATLPPEALEPRLLEPHPSWMTRIEEVWQERFAG